MDELKALNEFRSEVPPLEAAVLEATRDRLVDHMAAATRPNVLMMPVAPLRSLRRRLVIGIAGAAAAAAVAGVLVPGAHSNPVSPSATGSQNRGTTPNAVAVVPGAVTVAKVVRRAVAAAQHEAAIQPGQYLHVTVTDAADNPAVDETWVPADPSGTWLWRDKATQKSGYIYFSGRAGTTDRQLYPSQFTFSDARGHSEPFVAQYPDMIRCPAVDDEFAHNHCAALPTEPHALLKALYRLQVPRDVRESFRTRDQYAFAQIASILDTGLAPADLRVGLYKALQLLPGVKVTDSAVNAAGRSGIAIGMNNQSDQWGVNQELIFDKAAGNFIGERIVSLGTSKSGPPIAAGIVIESTSVTTNVVAQLPKFPQPIR